MNNPHYTQYCDWFASLLTHKDRARFHCISQQKPYCFLLSETNTKWSSRISLPTFHMTTVEYTVAVSCTQWNNWISSGSKYVQFLQKSWILSMEFTFRLLKRLSKVFEIVKIRCSLLIAQSIKVASWEKFQYSFLSWFFPSVILPEIQ